MSDAPVDTEALVAAGLYDPDAPDAPDRLALLAYLADEGASVHEMVEADGDGNLTSLALDRRLRGGERSAAELAEASGLAVADVVEAYRLLGIDVPDVDAPRFAEAEGHLLEGLIAARTYLPEGMAAEILRSIGAALASVAESSVSAFVGSFEDELEAGSQRTRAEVTTVTGELALELGHQLGLLLRHHLWAAVQRQRRVMRSTADRQQATLAVGFVDLVGFTPTTGRMTPTELLDLVRDFRNRTYDVVTTAGGRVVKHIGDEVMFAAADPDVACEIALGLVETFGRHHTAARGGVAHGPVVSRHGDHYGPTVNLAARLTDVAVQGEVLATAAMAALVDGDRFRLEPAGRRQLRGFDDPVAVVSVDRAAR